MGIRVNRNVGVKERNAYTFENFKGVDFSTSPYKVSGNRATQATNLIYKDGTVRKRNGWKSLCKLPGKINGLFSFELEGEKIVLCYAGTRFYRLEWNETTKRYDYEDVTDTCTYLPAALRYGQTRVNKFLGRNEESVTFYVDTANESGALAIKEDTLVEIELKTVEEVEPEVFEPVTIEITNNDMDLYGTALLDKNTAMTVGSVNFETGEIMLDIETVPQEEGVKNITVKFTAVPRPLIDRRAQLYVNDNKAYIIGCGDYLVYGKWGGDFELRRVYDNEDTYIPTTTINIDRDGVEDENRATLDDVNLLTGFRRNTFVGESEADEFGQGIASSYTVDTASIRVGAPPAIKPDTLVKVEIHLMRTVSIPGHSPYKEEFVAELSNETDEGELTGALFLKSDGNVAGSVDFQSGTIWLDIGTVPPEEDTPNVFITFYNNDAGQDQFQDYLSSVTIGATFGSGIRTDRLFLGGSNLFKNALYWSEENGDGMLAKSDYTYFPDRNWITLGGSGSEITGFAVQSDGVLLVFKEKIGAESTLYYITAREIDGTDSDGGAVTKIRFDAKMGNAVDTIYGKYASASLNGDNLILTKNGVKGIQIYENIYTSSYRIQERGRNINGKLLRHKNLADACGFVFKDKYYLSVDGVTYIADSRFTFENEEDINGSFNYEWWYWTNVAARVWCEIDNELCFGTADGLICRFAEEYADITIQETEAGDLTISNESFNTDKIAYNVDLDSALNENDSIIFTNGALFALYLEDTDILSVDEDGYLHVSDENIYKVYDGIELYADNVDGTGLGFNTKYVIGHVDLDNVRFSLLKDGDQVMPTGTGFRLCKKVSGKELFITNVDYDANELQLKEFASGEVLDLVYYDLENPSVLLATIKYKKNIRAEWFTPINDLGTNMFSKTLFNMTVSTEPISRGSVVVGYQTRNIEKDTRAKGAGIFDFNDIDFEDFSFDSSFANSFTFRAKERNFNFIVIRYVSDNQHSCAVNSITIRYKINTINKGVR